MKGCWTDMLNFEYRSIFAIAFTISFGFAFLSTATGVASQEKDAPAVATQKEDESVEDQQKRILNNYAQLEQKLLALREFEKESNPARSKLLLRAYELSQEQATTDGMKRVVSLLTTGELRDAESSQKQVLQDMNRLLTLLQSEDRGKRIEDELKRNQEYLKEVERLLRIQKSLRGETEAQGDASRISKSQKQAAERAKKLSDTIRDREEQSKEDAGPSDEAKESKDLQGNGQGKGKPGEPKSGKSSKGSPPEGESADGESSDSDSSPADEMNPVQKRVAAAEQKMRNAKKKLDQAKRDESIKDMDQAIRELEAAKKELEEILRQLREEEVERTLSMLEGRFRKMMEREIKVRDQTQGLNAVVPEQRRADFEIKAGKLSSEQSSIATEASRALLLLREDGSSVAFPQTVAEMKIDMEQVASRLSATKIGEMTIEIENDIIETLGYLVGALAQAQKENEANSKDRKKGKPGGRPGESSLVGKIAEIRMLRALQDRIFRRHTRYAKMLDDPGDLLGRTNDPDIRSALQRLTSKQKQLTEITKEIVESLND